jgi:hypothetical protein
MSAEYSSHDEIETNHSDLLTDLSEEDQESLAGGFLLYFNQREIYTDASNHTNYLGPVASNGGSENPTVTGNFNGFSRSSYYLRETTFLFSDSGQMPFYALPMFLRLLFMNPGREV